MPMSTKLILKKKKHSVEKLQNGNPTTVTRGDQGGASSDGTIVGAQRSPNDMLIGGISLLPKSNISGITSDFKSQYDPTSLSSNGLAAGPSQPDPGDTGGGGGNAAGVAKTAGMALAGAGAIVDAFKPNAPVNTWGIQTQTKATKDNANVSGALKGAGTGLSTGASLGSIAGPIGTGIGAVVGAIGGGIMGLLKAKKASHAKDQQIKDQTQAAYEDYNQKANAAQYAALGKYGAKLAVMNKIKNAKRDKISMKTRAFKAGGKLNQVGEVNIVPSGTLHKEKNNLGQKDKGLPIVNDHGKKMFEVEREELILRLEATKAVEVLCSAYKKTHNVQHLVQLGKLLTNEILKNTHDFSGKFGVEVKS